MWLTKTSSIRYSSYTVFVLVRKCLHIVTWEKKVKLMVIDLHLQANVRALSKGVQSVMGYKPGCGPVPAPKPGTDVREGKPWKKHGNRNKKEKVRRLNRHLEA